MANKEIGELTAATTPLAGTEEMHLVQGGNSRKVEVAALLARLFKFDLSSAFDGADRAQARANLGATNAVQTFTSGGYTADADDRANALIFSSAAQTLAFDAAANLGADWYVDVVAFDVPVTLAPDGSETVDGQSSVLVPPYRSCRVWCTGSVLRTNLARGEWEAIGEPVRFTSAQAAVEWTGLGDFIQLEVGGYVRPATDSVSIGLQFSSGGSWVAASNSYERQSVYSNGSSAGQALSNETMIWFTQADVGNASGSEGAAFNIFLNRFNVSDRDTWAHGTFQMVNVSGAGRNGALAGRRRASEAQDGLRVIASSGDLAEGYLMLRGMRG